VIPFAIRCKSRDLLKAIAEAQLYLRDGSVLDQLCAMVGPSWAVVVNGDGSCEVVPNDRSAPQPQHPPTADKDQA